MFKHYFTIFFRNIKKHKKTYSINLVGLSSSLTCVLLISLWVLDELKVDKFHENDDRIYQVMENVQQGNSIITSGYSSGPMAASMLEEIPEIEYATTSKKMPNDVTLSTDKSDLKAVGQYVGKDYFQIFSYKLVAGSKDLVLNDKNSIVISTDVARKMFGTTEGIVGKSIEFQREEEFTISGIFENLPANSTEQFDFLLSYEWFKNKNPWVLEWQNSITYTYILLRDKANIDALNEKLSGYIKDKSNGTILHRVPFIKKYSDNYLLGKYINGVQSGGRMDYVKLFSIIAVLIMVIACINFINLTTANSSIRFKEIGIKKVMGSGRKALSLQFFLESAGVILIASITAFLLVSMFLPEFNRITGKQLIIELNWPLLCVLFGFSILTTLLSGIYPALYLSKISPSSGIKGISNNSSGGSWIRRGLVVFQFAISTILILSVLVVYKQIDFIQSKDLGYDSENIIWFGREGKLSSDESLSTFLSEVKRLPGVLNASSIGHDLKGHNMGTYDLYWEGKDNDNKTQFENIAVNADMMETLDMELKEGRFFSNDIESDSESIIFNEEAIEHMGIEDPIGKTIRFWGGNMKIIGVVENFNFESMHEPIKPTLLRFAPSWTNNVMVKIERQKEQRALADLQDLYTSFNPGFSLDFKFLSDNYEAQYMSEHRVSILSKYFAGLAILISCLGLFGLTTFTTSRRRREIGIRKTLGQSSASIAVLISSEFVKLVLVSICIGLPISFLLAKDWLARFAYRTDLHSSYFVMAGLGAIFVALLTVSLQAIKAANMDPVKALRDE